jgi:ABC-type uncharacterized transport system substrate-binding protein
MAATTTIPIIFNVADDPVSKGYVASLSRPGGNVTGVNFLAQEVASKRFELLRELVPKATMTGLLVNPASTSQTERRQVEAAARAVGHGILVLSVNSASEIETAFGDACRKSSQCSARHRGSVPVKATWADRRAGGATCDSHHFL